MHLKGQSSSRLLNSKSNLLFMDANPGPGEYIQIQDWSESQLRRGQKRHRQGNAKYNNKAGQAPLKTDSVINQRVRGAVGAKEMIFDSGSRKKLVI